MSIIVLLYKAITSHWADCVVWVADKLVVVVVLMQQNALNQNASSWFVFAVVKLGASESGALQYDVV